MKDLIICVKVVLFFLAYVIVVSVSAMIEIISMLIGFIFDKIGVAAIKVVIWITELLRRIFNKIDYDMEWDNEMNTLIEKLKGLC